MVSLRLQALPALGPCSLIMLQPLEDGLIIRATPRTLLDVRVYVNQQRHLGALALVRPQQALKLLIDDDAVHLGKLKDVGNIIFLEPIVGRHDDTPRGHDAVDGLEEGRRVGGEDADAAVALLLEEVGQAPGAVGKGRVGAAEGDAVGGDVEDGVGVGLNGGGALEEEGWGEVVNVRRRRSGGLFLSCAACEVAEDGA